MKQKEQPIQDRRLIRRGRALTQRAVCGIVRGTSTLSDIESAVKALPLPTQQKLLRRLSEQLRPRGRAGRGLKAAARPAIEGLSAKLSVNTKAGVRAIITKRHAADR